MKRHELLDWKYGADGEDVLSRPLEDVVAPNRLHEPRSETPFHVVTRRRRAEAVELLLSQGVPIDAVTVGGVLAPPRKPAAAYSKNDILDKQSG